MTRSLRSNGSVLAAALAALLGACRSPLGGRDLDLTVSARALPGAGAGVALAQRMLERGSKRIDFELGLERQVLEERGPSGDEWTRAWAGLRSAPREGEGLHWAGGITWLRSQGSSSAIEEPGDYGGAYGSCGWSFAATRSLATGPELTLLFVDSEGDRSGSDAAAELAWGFTWHL